MNKIFKSFFIFLLLNLLVSCVHKIELVNFDTGDTIQGRYNTATKMVFIELDGEILSGRYKSRWTGKNALDWDYNGIGYPRPGKENKNAGMDWYLPCSRKHHRSGLCQISAVQRNLETEGQVKRLEECHGRRPYRNVLRCRPKRMGIPDLDVLILYIPLINPK